MRFNSNLKQICTGLFIFLLNINGISGVTDKCVQENFAFKPGEEIEYTVYYNWGILWVNAGIVSFMVDEISYMGRKVYHFDSYGRTHRKYDWIFKVRDRFQSYADIETFRPLWYEMDTYEGGFVARDIYNYVPEKNLVIATTENSDRPKQTDTIEIEPCSFDVVTAVYVARNIDFSAYEINDSIPFSILIGNRLYDLAPRFIGIETVKTREGEIYECIVFSVRLVEGFIFKPGDEMLVWVTNDDNRVPVMVEAQIRVGSVKAILKSAKGLRNPLSSLVN